MNGKIPIDSSLQKQLLIVALYGRGHWLASECQKMGYDVALLDLTHLINDWSVEDQEGPFGVFASKQHTSSQMARLTDEGPLILSDRGYVIWLKSGPLELKGPLGDFQLQNACISDKVIEYLRFAESLSASERSGFLSHIKKLSFEENWLAHLAHQISASTLMENTRGLTFGKVIPLMNSFYHRSFHKTSLHKTVFHKKAYQEDSSLFLSAVKKRLHLDVNQSFLEVQYQKNKRIKAQQVIWMLSSCETEFYFKESASVLFPKGVITPECYWTRYRMRFEKALALESLPGHFVMIEDIYLPWMHDNLSFVQRQALDIIDVWIRLPYTQRGEKDYVQHYGQCVQKQLEEKIPGCVLSIQDWPKDVQTNPEVLGPSVFGVYNLKERHNLERSSLKNMIFEGPEIWTSLSWNGQFRSCQKTLQKMIH